ncbi:MAG: Long-chain-fatty-acid--CoA ligase [Pseudomonadota bacterium]|jgi:long-chain acyl-CoA synthetase
MHNDASIYDLKPWVGAYGDKIQSQLEPLAYSSLPHLVYSASRSYADQVAFTAVVPNGMNGSLTYAQIARMSDAFAAYLREELKLPAGTRVALQLPNGLAYPIAAFGVLKAGCVLVNTNPLYTPSEMAHQFNDSGAQVLVVVEMFADKVGEILAKTGIKHVIVASVPELFPAVPRGIVRAVQRYWNKVLPPINFAHTRFAVVLAKGEEILNRGIKVESYWRDLRADAIACLQYTGGTTGVSKGAVLTHGNLLANVAQTLAMGGSHIDEGKECVLTALPLYHIFAFTVNLLSFYSVGARNVLIPSPRPVQNLQRAIENTPITWISGVNTLFNALLNEEWFVAYPPKQLKTSLAGGTALHAAVAQRWQQVTGTRIAEGFGLTESSPVVCFNPLTADPKADSIGIPVPGTDVALVDDEGRPVAQGEPGELIVRGPQVMQGYYNRVDETAKTIKNGWLYTGDVAVMDAQGYFKIVDRKKDMVLVSGFNVYPNEVEDALAKLDDIVEAAVVGIPDEKSGEAVRAYVVKREGATISQADVIKHCKTLLTDYKVPKSIVFRDELPKTPVGKVLRKALKAEVKAEFNLKKAA